MTLTTINIKTNKKNYKQYITTLPKQIMELWHVKDKAKIQWDINENGYLEAKIFGSSQNLQNHEKKETTSTE